MNFHPGFKSIGYYSSVQMSERVINDHLKFQGGSADTGISKMADIIQILAAHDYGGIHYHCLCVFRCLYQAYYHPSALSE